MLVQVNGFVPNKEVGEVPYSSLVYDISYDKDDKLRFLIWNFHVKEWEVVDATTCQPLQLPAQELRTKVRMKRVEELRVANAVKELETVKEE